MRTLRLIALTTLVAAGCYQNASPQATFPETDDWQAPSRDWQGPPGGSIDSGWGYAPNAPTADMPGDPQGYPQGYPEGSAPPVDGAEPQPAVASGDPMDPGYVMGDVTDGEIDTTLAPYGQWGEDDDYGRVWRPDPTIVGADFTPYETNGSWLYTDYGWTFDCDYDWGWLPFHYGRWAYLDSGWGWVPDHTWAPAWVDWRHGGGYVGWRPTGPNIRDHRTGGHLTVHDHRTGHGDDHWKFAATTEFGKGHIHDHLSTIANGMSVTTAVARPPFHGEYGGRAASVMTGRLTAHAGIQSPGRGYRQPTPVTGYQQPGRPYQPTYRQPAPVTTYQQPGRPYQPTYRQPAPVTTYQQPGRPYQPTYRQPAPVTTYQQPGRPYQPTYRQPAPVTTYQQPGRPYQPTYQPPRTYQQPVYSPPSRPSYSPPSHPSYSPPSRPSYSPPSHSYSAPSHSYSAPSHSYSAPSHSSSSSSHSSSGGGGGRHR